MCLLVEKDRAVDDRLDQRADAVLLGLGLIEDGFDHPSVAKGNRRTGRIGDQLIREVSSDLFGITQYNSLELLDVVERFALGGLVMRIDRYSFPGGFGVAVPRPPTPDHVVVFQCEARRVDLDVTGRAGRLVTVFSELIADRNRAANVGLNGWDVVRRRRDFDAEDAFIDERAANHR